MKSESTETVKKLCKFRVKQNVGVVNGDGMNAIHIAIQLILVELFDTAKKTDLTPRSDHSLTSDLYLSSGK